MKEVKFDPADVEGIDADPLPDDIEEGDPDETTRWDHSDTPPGEE
jgi:hypothetical protein